MVNGIKTGRKERELSDLNRAGEAHRHKVHDLRIAILKISRIAAFVQSFAWRFERPSDFIYALFAGDK